MTDLELATYVHRAIHTLEHLRDSGALGNEESAGALFAEQSWRELRRVQAWLRDERGVRPADIDIGDYVQAGESVVAHERDRQALAAWTAGAAMEAR